MRLHVGVLGVEELLHAVAREVLDNVSKFAAAVVALAGISFGVLIGEDAAGGFEYGLANKVLGGDELEALVLAALLVVNRLRDFRINFSQRAFHLAVDHLDNVLPDGFGLREE